MEKDRQTKRKANKDFGITEKSADSNNDTESNNERRRHLSVAAGKISGFKETPLNKDIRNE